MKKSFLLLPLVVALSGCYSSSPAPAQHAEISNAIPMGMNSEIQQATMPTNMTYSNTGYSAYPPNPTVPPVTPVYVPPTNTTYTNTNYSNTASAPVSAEISGSCQVIRDANNAPLYAQMPKGCYTQETYTVKKGDTIFLIAYLAGKSVEEIAALNQLPQPYQLKIGQTVRVR